MANPGGYYNQPETKMESSSRFSGVIFQRPIVTLSGLIRDYVVNYNQLLAFRGFEKVFAGERRCDKRRVAIKLVCLSTLSSVDCRVYEV